MSAAAASRPVVEGERPRRFAAGSSSRVTAGLVGAQGVTALAALVVNVASAHALSPSDRGVVALLIQLSYVAVAFALLGVERPYVVQRRTGAAAAEGELWWILRPSLTILGVVAVIAAIGLPWRFSPTAVLAVTAVATLGFLSARIQRTAYIASGDARAFVTSTVSSQLLLMVGSGGLALAPARTVVPWMALYAATFAIPLCSSAIRGRVGVGASLSRSTVTTIRRAGLALIPASLGNIAMLRSDRLLLPALSGVRELGIYVLAATSLELAAWPVQNYVDAALNRWGSARSGARVLVHCLVAAAVTAVAAVVLGLATWAIVSWFLPDEYASSARLIVPLGAASVSYAASRVVQGHLIAAGRNGSASACEVVSTAASVAFYLTLIPPFGAMGAAVGSFGGYTLALVFAVLLWRRGPKAAPA